MIKFIVGVIVGVLIFFLVIFFGGGKGMKKLGEGLTDTGKKMEAMEELIKKEKDDVLKGAKKKILKEGSVTTKENQ
jgi:uncharacterized membrane protein (DUF106 family)